MVRHARIIVDTAELIKPEQLAELFALHEQVGYFFFLEKPEVVIDTAKLPNIQLEDGGKSPSQRLRATLYVWWQQNGIKDDFELFTAAGWSAPSTR